MKNVVEAARGRWPEILRHFNVILPLKGKHGPCPACGGKDRFRFDNKEDRGTFYCSGCGAGDGFILLEKIRGCELNDAVNMVADYLHLKPVDAAAKKADENMRAIKELWDRSKEPAHDGPVQKYLISRIGRYMPSNSIRECLSVFDPDTRKHYPAMIAQVSAKGVGVNIHITYLTKNGQKAKIPTPKRVMAGRLPEGSCVRLGLAEPTMGIAEGIETAMAASEMFMMPVWACLNGNGLTKWVPPEGVTKVVVFGDNDLNYTGQAKAYTAAQRLTLVYKKIVDVMLPKKVGTDWNNVLTNPIE